MWRGAIIFEREANMNWKMIPFTKIPPINQMTRLERYIRTTLLGIVVGTPFGFIGLPLWRWLIS